MAIPNPLAINTTVTGLGTFVFTLPTADNYTIQGTLQLPNIVPSGGQSSFAGAGGTGGGPQVNSQVLVTIKHNTTTIYTGSAGQQGFLTGFAGAAAGDTLSVILSSSLAQDNQLNAVQCSIQVYEGVAL